jgi:hypothetical protein
MRNERDISVREFEGAQVPTLLLSPSSLLLLLLLLSFYTSATLLLSSFLPPFRHSSSTSLISFRHAFSALPYNIFYKTNIAEEIFTSYDGTV